ncbi:hypothetical protein OROGR_016904 [Orobanche gracilis]
MNTSAGLDKWREYFRSANSDIFDIIEKAIVVAASDCPYDFKLKRDRIAETLFACKITKCFGCDRLELAVPNGDDDVEKSEDKFIKSGIEAGGSKDTKESKVNSSIRDDGDDDADDDDNRKVMVMEMNVNHVGDDSYADVEALTDEIEEESQFYGEVLRIKEILDNYEEELLMTMMIGSLCFIDSHLIDLKYSDALLFDSLRRLQLMPLSVESLKATEIGKSVSALRKHGSGKVRNLVRTLLEDWKIMVVLWCDATTAIAGTEIQTESVKTSVVEEEEGLPSPPLDEGAFFATPTSMELSQFFDGMDDDGNHHNCGELNKNRENVRSKPTVEKTDTHHKSKTGSRHPSNDKTGEPNRNLEVVLRKEVPPKPNGPPGGERGLCVPKTSNYESGPGRPKPVVKPKVDDINKFQQSHDKGTVQKKPTPPQNKKLSRNNEASVRMKLEAAKRKLHERYQEVENAKKHRTIQVVELRDLPKQSVAQTNQQARPGNRNRNWANGRR